MKPSPLFKWLIAEKPQSSAAIQVQVQSVGISLVADTTAAVSFYINCAFICVSNPFAVCNLQSKAISDPSWESHFSLIIALCSFL